MHMLVSIACQTSNLLFETCVSMELIIALLSTINKHLNAFIILIAISLPVSNKGIATIMLRAERMDQFIR